jgi:hypothetical protein
MLGITVPKTRPTQEMPSETLSSVSVRQQRPALERSRVQARLGGPMVRGGSRMPFDFWSDLALTALCGTALVIWIGRDLAARTRQRRA